MMRFNKSFLLVFLLITLNILAIFLVVSFNKSDDVSLDIKKKPFISVVVTSYNYEKYIKKTLDSILNQSYKNYEVIIVEDNSKDNSMDIIKKYVSKYKNFHLFTHENNQNKGLIESIRLGINKSSGEYIAFLESDDYWHKDNLLEKVKLINEYNEASFLSNNVEPFGDENTVKIRKDYIKRINMVLFKKKNGIHPLQLNDFNIVPTFSAVMIKKDVLEKLNFNSPIPEYLDFWLYRQILLKEHLYYTKKVLTYWRQHDSYNSFEKNKKHASKFNSFVEENNKIIFSNQ